MPDTAKKIVVVEIHLLFERGYEDRFQLSYGADGIERALHRLEEKGVKREELFGGYDLQVP